MTQVFLVLARGTDYYDQPEVTAVYSTREGAEDYAARLRELPAECPEYGDDLEYEEVFVQEWDVKDFTTEKK